MKSLIQIHTQNNGIYQGPIKEIVGQKCNLYIVKNFLQSLPFYKLLQTQAGEKFLITHAPTLIPKNLGDLKRSIAIYRAEQLQQNLRLSQSEVLKNNTNFLKAVGNLYKQNPIISVFGHIDLQPLIDQYQIPGAISLEGKVDQGGHIKVLVLSDQDGKISQTIEKIPSQVNYKSSEQKQNLYSRFANNPLINKKDYGDLSIFKYKKKVFYQNLWGKNDHQTNQTLLKARGLVLDKQGNIVSYPFDKIFNYGEKILNKNNELITDHTGFNGKYEFVEKINGFLGIISPHPYNPQELLIHTSGSLDGKYVDYIRELLRPDQKKAILRFFRENGPHTFMFEVVHPQDPHIIKYSPEQMGLYLIGLRKIEDGDMEDMKLYTEEELDKIAQELGFKRPKHFVDTFDNILKNLRKQKIEGYMVRDIQDGKHLVKLKTPYYLTTKFLARMNEKNYKFLFNNKDEFIKTMEIDEEFLPLVDWIFENQDEFKQLDETQKAQKIAEFLDSQFRDNGYQA